MSYAGNLKRSVTTTPDDHTSSFAPDPLHNASSPELVQAYQETRQVPGSTGADYAGSDFPLDMAEGGGTVIATMRNTHDGNAGRRQCRDEAAHTAFLASGVHEEDGQRRVVASEYSDGWIQPHQSVYSEAYTEGLPLPTGPNYEGSQMLTRGRTGWGYRGNNDMSVVRRGFQRQGPWYEAERLLYRQYRRRTYHAPQQLGDRRVNTPRNWVSPDPGGMAQAVLSYWPLAGKGQRLKVPGMFREPDSVSAAQLATETDSDTNTIGEGF